MDSKNRQTLKGMMPTQVTFLCKYDHIDKLLHCKYFSMYVYKTLGGK